MKQPQVLAHFEKSSDEITKYFTIKYSNNYHLIRELQNQRKILETPLQQAKRTLRSLEQDGERIQRSGTRQTDRMKGTFSSTFTRPNSQVDTFMQTNHSFDINAGQIQLQNMKAIFESLQNKTETPNFQLYWEAVFEFRQEQYLYYFVRPATQKILWEYIFLSDISFSFVQCQLKDNILHNQQIYYQEMTVLTKLFVENFALFLNQMIKHLKQRNQLVEQLQQKIDVILERNNPCISFPQEIKRNNCFIKSIIEKLLQNDNQGIQAIIITCRYQLQHLNILDVTISRPQLRNAIYLSTQQIKKQEYQSPLKTLFNAHMVPKRQSQVSVDLMNSPFIQSPFLKQLCIILDLDETMGHFSEQLNKFISRPWLFQFLESIKPFCEIIIFTAGQQNYADNAISQIQCDHLIDHKLYRHQTVYNGIHFIKDLSKIGRPLEKTIIIDNTPINFQLQQENGLVISSWVGKSDDKELLNMKDLITKIAQSKVTDVRKALKKYRDYMSRNNR
ncbi:unnamed protein product (macronuclear) [Paramecium tetraurelia]|uniref:Mitochondrial import inner membrane translocase subunit TIM50 n=1 Tax=Paramecium tetraurelia TaxID=5888 RepID=A0C2C8_PARTE|nr:uncharacterized protein GSPATT00034422001 [Paramecium tetraurelia]CAK64945.1 unnamed protein product [Paramecium tetraurelia]|eukprot:XP_001432342.1 hypothetical protein (macronuclear) [Paramecium tetraurelia strain d4-2]